MKKIDRTVIKETVYISAWVLIFSAIMQAVFLIIHKWNYTVLLGNLLSGVAVTLNFFLMGLTVQSSLGKEEKAAKKAMKLSQAYRYLLLIIILVIGVVFSCFNNWTVFIPVVFPRIAIAMRPIFNKNKKVAETNGAQANDESAGSEQASDERE